MKTLPLRPNVCMLVINSANLLFLGERHGEPGIWQFPQGGVESSSSLEENVYRELQEELGISRSLLNIEKRLNSTHEYEFSIPPDYARDKWRGQSQTFWVVRFAGNESDINLKAHEEQEFMSYRWCSMSEVEQLAEPKRLKGYRSALTELAQHLA